MAFPSTCPWCGNISPAGLDALWSPDQVRRARRLLRCTRPLAAIPTPDIAEQPHLCSDLFCINRAALQRRRENQPVLQLEVGRVSSEWRLDWTVAGGEVKLSIGALLPGSLSLGTVSFFLLLLSL